MIKKFISLFIFSIAFSAPIEIGIGTRAQGMGGAFVGIANDASAVYWNPAGLGLVNIGEARFMHWMPTELSGVNIEWIGMNFPLFRISEEGGEKAVYIPQGIGIAWLRKAATLEEGRDTITSSMAENTYSISYGIAPIEQISFGITLNRFSLNSEIGGSAGLGFDVGILWKPTHIFRIGLIARNISANMGNENFPTNYRAGIGLCSEKFTFAAELTTKEGVNEKEGLTLHYFTGIEWKVIPQFSLRLGYNDINTISAGFGFDIKKIIIEYAYSGMKEEGLTSAHRIELGYKFKL